MTEATPPGGVLEITDADGDRYYVHPAAWRRIGLEATGPDADDLVRVRVLWDDRTEQIIYATRASAELVRAWMRSGGTAWQNN